MKYNWENPCDCSCACADCETKLCETDKQFYKYIGCSYWDPKCKELECEKCAFQDGYFK